MVAEVRLTKVLIDGGSGLNLIFASTLRKMGLDFKDMLVLSKSPFYGIIPGNVAHPLGMVVLPVTFGMRENYRTEFIKFEVANFESSYHAILGHPARQVYGSATLHLSASQDARTQWSTHSPGRLEEVV
jgi:hypothetical protein